MLYTAIKIDFECNRVWKIKNLLRNTKNVVLSNSILFVRTAVKDIVVASEHKHILNILSRF